METVEEYRQNFERYLKEKMESNGWSIAALARAAGLQETTMRNFVRYDCMPNIYTAITIAENFNVSLDELFGRKVR